jgi:hypothetical protein
LVRDTWTIDEPRTAPLPGGAALVEGATAWALIDDPVEGSLGGAMAWAARHGVRELHVLVENAGAAGLIARRAGEFAGAPTVWLVEGRAVRPAAPGPVAATDVATPEVAAPEVAAFCPLLEAHGVDPVVEGGHLVGEVLGLEVARVVVTSDGSHLEVGVGANDRRARRELYPDQDPGAALDEVVNVVRAWRVAGAVPHPANLLARERWLRAAVVFRPQVAGAVKLSPFGPGAVGESADGERLIVACSIGVDLDLVPAAADLRLHAGDRDARLVIVVPEGDDYPITRELSGALRNPGVIVTVGRDWPALLQ